MTYKMFTATASSTDNVVELIFKELEEKYNQKYPTHVLHFIGFESEAGLEFELNGVKFNVPKTGKFITPYERDNYMNISELYFTDGCSGQNIYYII